MRTRLGATAPSIENSPSYIFDSTRPGWRLLGSVAAAAFMLGYLPRSARGSAKQSVKSSLCSRPSIKNVHFKLQNEGHQEYSVVMDFDINNSGQSTELDITDGVLPVANEYLSPDEHHWSDRVAFDYWNKPHVDSYYPEVNLRTNCGSYSADFGYSLPLSRNSCADIEVVDLHGSGANAYEIDPAGASFGFWIERLALKKTVEVETVPFPAAGGDSTLIAAKANLPTAYHKSVVKMKKWLPVELKKIHSTCPDSLVFISAYSQGAQSAGDVFQANKGKGVDGMVLFGDPSYNPYDKSDHFGLNDPKIKDRHTKYQGILHMRPPFNNERVWSFCHRGDYVCQGLGRILHWPQHKNYDQFNEPKIAAEYFVGHLG